MEQSRSRTRNQIAQDDEVTLEPGIEAGQSSAQSTLDTVASSTASATQQPLHDAHEQTYPYKPPRIDNVRYQTLVPDLLSSTPYVKEEPLAADVFERMLKDAHNEDLKRVRVPNVPVPITVKRKGKVITGRKLRSSINFATLSSDELEVPDIHKFPSAFASLPDRLRWNPEKCQKILKGDAVAKWLRFARNVLQQDGAEGTVKANTTHSELLSKFHEQGRLSYGISRLFDDVAPDKFDERALNFLHDCDYDIPRAKLQLVSQMGGGFESASLERADTVYTERTALKLASSNLRLSSSLESNSTSVTSGPSQRGLLVAADSHHHHDKDKSHVSILRLANVASEEQIQTSGYDLLKALLALQPLRCDDGVHAMFGQPVGAALDGASALDITESTGKHSDSQVQQAWQEWVSDLSEMFRGRVAAQWDSLIMMRDRALQLHPLNPFAGGGGNAQLARRANELCADLAKKLAAAARWRAKLRDILSRTHSKLDYSALESHISTGQTLWVQVPEQSIGHRVFKACQKSKKHAEKLISRAAIAAARAMQRYAVHSQRLAALRVATAQFKRSNYGLGLSSLAQSASNSTISSSQEPSHWISAQEACAPRLGHVSNYDQTLSDSTGNNTISNSLVWEDYVRAAAAKLDAKSTSDSIYGSPLSTKPNSSECVDSEGPPYLPPEPEPVSIMEWRDAADRLERLPVQFPELGVIKGRIQYIESLAGRIRELFPKHAFHSAGPSGSRVPQAHMLSTLPKWTLSAKLPPAPEQLVTAPADSADTNNCADDGKWIEDTLNGGGVVGGVNARGGCAYVSYKSPDTGAQVATAGGTAYAGAVGRSGAATGVSLQPQPAKSTDVTTSEQSPTDNSSPADSRKKGKSKGAKPTGKRNHGTDDTVTASTALNSDDTNMTQVQAMIDSQKRRQNELWSRVPGMPNIVVSKLTKSGYKLARLPSAHIASLYRDIEDTGIGFQEGILLQYFGEFERDWKRKCNALMGRPLPPTISEIRDLMEAAEKSPIDLSEDIAMLRQELMRAARWLVCARSVVFLCGKSMRSQLEDSKLLHEQLKGKENNSDLEENQKASPNNQDVYGNEDLSSIIRAAQRRSADLSPPDRATLEQAHHLMRLFHEGSTPLLPEYSNPVQHLIDTAEDWRSKVQECLQSVLRNRIQQFSDPLTSSRISSLPEQSPMWSLLVELLLEATKIPIAMHEFGVLLTEIRLAWWTDRALSYIKSKPTIQALRGLLSELCAIRTSARKVQLHAFEDDISAVAVASGLDRAMGLDTALIQAHREQKISKELDMQDARSTTGSMVGDENDDSTSATPTGPSNSAAGVVGRPASKKKRRKGGRRASGSNTSSIDNDSARMTRRARARESTTSNDRDVSVDNGPPADKDEHVQDDQYNSDEASELDELDYSWWVAPPLQAYIERIIAQSESWTKRCEQLLAKHDVPVSALREHYLAGNELICAETEGMSRLELRIAQVDQWNVSAKNMLESLKLLNEPSQCQNKCSDTPQNATISLSELRELEQSAAKLPARPEQFDQLKSCLVRIEAWLRAAIAILPQNSHRQKALSSPFAAIVAEFERRDDAKSTISNRTTSSRGTYRRKSGRGRRRGGKIASSRKRRRASSANDESKLNVENIEAAIAELLSRQSMDDEWVQEFEVEELLHSAQLPSSSEVQMLCKSGVLSMKNALKIASDSSNTQLQTALRLLDIGSFDSDQVLPVSEKTNEDALERLLKAARVLPIDVSGAVQWLTAHLNMTRLWRAHVLHSLSNSKYDLDSTDLDNTQTIVEIVISTGCPVGTLVDLSRLSKYTMIANLEQPLLEWTIKAKQWFSVAQREYSSRKRHFEMLHRQCPVLCRVSSSVMGNKTLYHSRDVSSPKPENLEKLEDRAVGARSKRAGRNQFGMRKAIAALKSRSANASVFDVNEPNTAPISTDDQSNISVSVDQRSSAEAAPKRGRPGRRKSTKSKNNAQTADGSSVRQKAGTLSTLEKQFSNTIIGLYHSGLLRWLPQTDELKWLYSLSESDYEAILREMVHMIEVLNTDATRYILEQTLGDTLLAADANTNEEDNKPDTTVVPDISSQHVSSQADKNKDTRHDQDFLHEMGVPRGVTESSIEKLGSIAAAGHQLLDDFEALNVTNEMSSISQLKHIVSITECLQTCSDSASFWHSQLKRSLTTIAKLCAPNTNESPVRAGRKNKAQNTGSINDFISVADAILVVGLSLMLHVDHPVLHEISKSIALYIELVKSLNKHSSAEVLQLVLTSWNERHAISSADLIIDQLLVEEDIAITDKSPSQHLAMQDTLKFKLPVLRSVHAQLQTQIGFETPLAKAIAAELEQAENWLAEFNRITKYHTDTSEIEELLDESNTLLVDVSQYKDQLRRLSEPQCLCQQPWKSPMLQCMGCNRYYHGQCIARTKDECTKLAGIDNARMKAWHHLVANGIQGCDQATHIIAKANEAKAGRPSMAPWRCNACLADAGINVAVIRGLMVMRRAFATLRELPAENLQVDSKVTHMRNSSTSDNIEKSTIPNRLDVIKDAGSEAAEALSHAVQSHPQVTQPDVSAQLDAQKLILKGAQDWLLAVEDVFTALGCADDANYIKNVDEVASTEPPSGPLFVESKSLNATSNRRWICRDGSTANSQGTSTTFEIQQKLLSPYHLESLRYAADRCGIAHILNQLSSEATDQHSYHATPDAQLMWFAHGQDTLFQSPTVVIRQLKSLLQQQDVDDMSGERKLFTQWPFLSALQESFPSSTDQLETFAASVSFGMVSNAFSISSIQDAVVVILRALRALQWRCRFVRSLRRCEEFEEVRAMWISAAFTKLPCVNLDAFCEHVTPHDDTSVKLTTPTIVCPDPCLREGSWTSHGLFVALSTLVARAIEWRAEARPLLAVTGPQSIARYETLLETARSIPIIFPEESSLSAVVTDGGHAYCLCGGLSDGRFMIACDVSGVGCRRWYHGDCVGHPAPADTEQSVSAAKVAASLVATPFHNSFYDKTHQHTSVSATSHHTNENHADVETQEDSETQEEIFMCPVCAIARMQPYRYANNLPLRSITLLCRTLLQQSPGLAPHVMAAFGSRFKLEQVGDKSVCAIVDCDSAEKSTNESRVADSHIQNGLASPQPFYYLTAGEVSVALSDTNRLQEAARKSGSENLSAHTGQKSNSSIVSKSLRAAWSMPEIWPMKLVTEEIEDLGNNESQRLLRTYGLGTKNSRVRSVEYFQSADGIRETSKSCTIYVYPPTDPVLASVLRSADSLKSRMGDACDDVQCSDVDENSIIQSLDYARLDAVHQGILQYLYNTGGAETALMYAQALQHVKRNQESQGSSSMINSSTSAFNSSISHATNVVASTTNVSTSLKATAASTKRTPESSNSSTSVNPSAISSKDKLIAKRRRMGS